ncbi:hypothetical protein BGP75_25365 [Motiliproteus sp. MSK22-1]|nr:hypothetical protein BGP75_25365 [Motiliproteus sp. MSK22-1]
MLPITVLIVSAYGVNYIVNNKPDAKRGRPQGPQAMTVEGTRLHRQDFQVWLDSYGVVKPRTESHLVSQVAGKVVKISERFREGAFFEAGDILIRIDPRDYQVAVDIAEAELIQAQLGLKEEQARVEQALRDWKRLGKGVAGDLVLRKPQLAAADAAISSAKAKLVRAKLSLERTRIKAPYAGRLLSKQVDLGQVVSSGTVLAEIFAVDYVEVRLPLNNRQLEYVSLPEQYRGGELRSGNLPEVSLQAQIGRQQYSWSGKVVRVEGAIDQGSRQLFVVAQIEDPYSLGPQGNPPLKIGQFVQAKIKGKLLQGVYVFPRTALNQDNTVLIIEKGRLQSRILDPLWTDEESVVASSGLENGDLLNLTPMGAGVSGLAVRAVIDGEPLVNKNGADKERKRKRPKQDEDRLHQGDPEAAKPAVSG